MRPYLKKEMFLFGKFLISNIPLVILYYVLFQIVIGLLKVQTELGMWIIFTLHSPIVFLVQKRLVFIEKDWSRTSYEAIRFFVPAAIVRFLSTAILIFLSEKLVITLFQAQLLMTALVVIPAYCWFKFVFREK